MDSLNMDLGVIQEGMNEAKNYYSAMSWGKFGISYEILNQYLLSISSQKPNMYVLKDEVMSYVKSRNKSYDGVIVIYHTPNDGPLRNSIYGTTNEDPGFIWLKYNTVDLGSIRHEMGHNFGHYHHVVNTYDYRETNKYTWNPMDHFDMVSFLIKQ